MLDGLVARIERGRRAAGRATLLPFLVRGGIALSLVLAMSVGWPAQVAASRYMVLLFVVAIYPALAPRGRGATIAILVVVAGWVLDTTWFDDRGALVVLISAVLTVVALGLTSALAGSAFLVATLVGLAGAVGATMLLARLLRRA